MHTDIDLASSNDRLVMREIGRLKRIKKIALQI